MDQIVNAFAHVFELCKVTPAERVVLLCESESRAQTVALAAQGLSRATANFFELRLPSPPPVDGPLIRSTGASHVLTGNGHAVETLLGADFIVDLTVEGLMHAPQTASLLKSGARILTVSNEHPEALLRLTPDAQLKSITRDAVSQCRQSRTMVVTSDAGTRLTVDMTHANVVGVWGWTDKPGTLTHWPGGLVVCFPAKASVNGRLVLQPGDMNLTFKRYVESEVAFDIRDDFIVAIEGGGTDARLMREYFTAFEEANAYAVSHVGWGLNSKARYEALTMYDKRDTNGTEARAIAGSFLYSTGANEFADRYTRGHFDLPMMKCSIHLDDRIVVDQGNLV